jgi:hypothetical protein
MRQAWQPVSGDWAVADNHYAVAFNGGTSLSTITEYRSLDPAAPPDTQLRQQNYLVRARVLITSGCIASSRISRPAWELYPDQ